MQNLSSLLNKKKETFYVIIILIFSIYINQYYVNQGICPIRDENNNFHIGSNVENSAYPIGNCAEASAISAMITSRGTRIIAIAVTGYGKMLCTPCGGCRQRIREFSEPNTPIIIGNENGIQKIFTLSDLLPFSFGPENLNEI